MKRFVFPSWLCSVALICVGCTPSENTSTPSPVVEDPDRRMVTLKGSDDAVSICFNADSRTLASANLDKTVSLWEVQTRQESARLSDEHRSNEIEFIASCLSPKIHHRV